MRYLAHYSTNYQPAMPVLEIALSLSKADTPIMVEALVDSGADATLIPQRYLRRLGAKPIEERWLRGVTGWREQVRLYTLFINIGGQEMYIRVVGLANSHELILGRDVLNQFIITLDGLSQTTIVQDE
jgi:predicted aspartyl protease